MYNKTLEMRVFDWIWSHSCRRERDLIYT